MRLLLSLLLLLLSLSCSSSAPAPDVKLDATNFDEKFYGSFKANFEDFGKKIKEEVGVKEFQHMMESMDTNIGKADGMAGFTPPSESDLKKMANPAKFLMEQLLENHKPTDYIDIELSDGTIKSVQVADVIERMEKQSSLMEKIGRMEDGKFVSEDSGTASMSDIASKPEHAKLKMFIMLGKFGLSILKSVGYAEGELVNVESSPRYDPEIAVENGGDPNLPTLLIVSTKDDQGEVSRYELEFEIDRKYVEPNAAAINGWKILPGDDYERGEELVLPYPVLRPQLWGFYVEELREMCVKIGVLFLCVGTVSFFSTKFFEGKSKGE